MNTFASVLLCLVVSLAVSCGSRELGASREEMLGGLRSGMKLADAAAVLRVDGHPLAGDQPTNVETVAGQRIQKTQAEVAEFSDLGYKGRLRLGFFDDQLVRVEFEPVDLEAYLAAYQQTSHVDLRKSTAKRGEIEVFLLELPDQPGFVGWEDSNLRRKFNPID